MKIPPDKIISWIINNFEYKTRKNNSEYLICNPFTGDSKYKMNINPEQGNVHCWTGNEWAGPLNPKTNKRNCTFINLVKQYKKCSYPEAIKEVIGLSSDWRQYLKAENRLTQPDLKVYDIKMPVGAEPILESGDEQADILIRWLKSRGYTAKEIETNNLHHIGMSVCWPYYEFEILVYWQSRSRISERFAGGAAANVVASASIESTCGRAAACVGFT